MTAKAKAEELIKWATIYGASQEVSKLFAIKLVDEILKENIILKLNMFYCKIDYAFCCEQYEYWERVRKEIEKL